MEMNFQRNSYCFQAHVFILHCLVTRNQVFSERNVTWILSTLVLFFLGFSLPVCEINITVFSMAIMS